jgi:hypothetical protein
MTATVPTSRILALLGLAVAALAAFFLLVRPMLLDDSEATPTAANNAVQPSAPAAKPKPAKPAVRPARPAVELLPGLPANVARALRRERVVVAAVWAPGGSDAAALDAARKGAQSTGAGFVAVNVLYEGHARALERLVGPISDPSVLVFRRPGKVVNRFEGFADSATVAQAAHNAGAR